MKTGGNILATDKVCGNCKFYTIQMPPASGYQKLFWAFCNLHKKHFKKDGSGFPAYQTCAKWELNDLDIDKVFQEKSVE